MPIDVLCADIRISTDEPVERGLRDVGPPGECTHHEGGLGAVDGLEDAHDAIENGVT